MIIELYLFRFVYYKCYTINIAEMHGIDWWMINTVIGLVILESFKLKFIDVQAYMPDLMKPIVSHESLCKISI